MILVELLHTLGIFFGEHRLFIQPFLAVGIIAVIRRVLVITAEHVDVKAVEETLFQMVMIELGVLTGKQPEEAAAGRNGSGDTRPIDTT